jgi:hypothetical protein
MKTQTRRKIDKQAMFTLPTTIDEQRDLYLKLIVTKGYAEGDSVVSQNFAALAPAQAAARLRLTGLQSLLVCLLAWLAC